MKLKSATSRKLRYGGVTAVLTALIIAVIIVINVIFSALSQKLLWYTDLTPELYFTLSENCIDLLENGDDEFGSTSAIEMLDTHRAERRAEDPEFEDEELMINIIFCDDPDVWGGATADSAMRYVNETAGQLQKEFPDYIQVKYYNTVYNPSSVTKYGSGVTTTSVIIEYGTEYRVRALRDFYTFDTDDSEEPWAYNGEKIMAAAILAVTRAEAPIACITNNHGEQWVYGKNEQLLLTLDTAGFKVQQLDLAQQEIPEDCRLLVVMDPQQDFSIADGVTNIDEIAKLEDFLDEANSLMVFMSCEDRLNNFEEFLEEWGIVFNRYEEGNELHPLIVRDPSQALLTEESENLYTIKANYYTEGGIGSDMTEELRERSAVAPTIVFKNAMPISFNLEDSGFTMQHYTDEEDETLSFDYATRYSDGVTRSIYDVFVTSENGEAWANGARRDKATEANPLKLLTVSTERYTTQEDNYSTLSEASYVIACGSPEFADNDVLTNNSYGNNAFLEYALRVVGQEPVPVGLERKPFGDYTIDTVTTAEATQYTVVLSVVPAVLAAGIGIFVIVRRKNR